MEKLKKEKIEDILTRGVGEFIDPDGTFRKKLETSPEKIIIKFGIDPTRPDIHIGHAVVLRKLRQFQDLGCKVVFLIGDYTAGIGDPTGKDKTRLEIEQKEIEYNMQTYMKQIVKILKQEKEVFSWVRNSDWFVSVTDLKPAPSMKVRFTGSNKMFGVFDANSFVGKALLFEETRMQKTHLKNNIIHTISLSFVLKTLRKISHNRLLERDMFKKRLQNNEELFMHEMLYPVLQGIDSHVLSKVYGSCDLEVGGTDQHFNMLMGRQIMTINKQDPQAVISFKILEGLDGKEKMSKSLDNYIGITDEPNDMYGKVMSIPDSSIVSYFELCTFTPLSEVSEIKKKLEGSLVNPKDLKMELAKQIVSMYHGEKKAIESEANFVNTFSKKEIPENVEEVDGAGKLLEVFVSNNLTSSMSEARRLLEAGAVTDMTEDKKLTGKDTFVSGHTYKIGKHRFIKIK
jgi:tyrosyl-tRNA synthetase